MVEQKYLKNNNFHIQIELFEKVYRERFGGNEDFDEVKLTSFVVEAKRLRGARNTIAHNSLGLVFEELDAGSLRLVGFEVENKEHKNTSFNYEQFLCAVKDAKQCREMLEHLTSLHYEEEANRIMMQIGKDSQNDV